MDIAIYGTACKNKSLGLKFLFCLLLVFILVTELTNKTVIKANLTNFAA